MQVHFLNNYGKNFLDFLKEKSPEEINYSYGVVHPNNKIEILIGGRPSEKDIKQSILLKKLIIPYVGIPEKTRKLMQRFPEIKVHNLHHNSLSVAEFALGFLFCAAKDLIPAHNSLKTNNWEIRYGPNPSEFISGKTVLLLGFGEIARDFVRLSGGLNFNYIAVNRSGKNSSKFDIPVHSVEKLDSLLPKADYIICSLPLTEKTKNLIDIKKFELMKKKATIINVGRAKIFNENDLYAALKYNLINSAFLDVWYNYPRNVKSRKNTSPTNLEFNKLDNLFYSPHRASGLGMKELEELRASEIIRYLKLIIEDKKVPHEVNLEEGY